MNRKKYGQLKLAILEILENSDKCTVDQICNDIYQKYGMSGVSKQHVSTSISQLMSSGEPISRIEKGTYKIDKSDSTNAINIKEYDNALESCLLLQKKLEKILNYNLSPNDYAKYQRLYFISKDCFASLKDV